MTSSNRTLNNYDDVTVIWARSESNPTLKSNSIVWMPYDAFVSVTTNKCYGSGWIQTFHFISLFILIFFEFTVCVIHLIPIAVPEYYIKSVSCSFMLVYNNMVQRSFILRIFILIRFTIKNEWSCLPSFSILFLISKTQAHFMQMVVLSWKNCC